MSTYSDDTCPFSCWFPKAAAAAAADGVRTHARADRALEGKAHVPGLPFSSRREIPRLPSRPLYIFPFNFAVIYSWSSPPPQRLVGPTTAARRAAVLQCSRLLETGLPACLSLPLLFLCAWLRLSLLSPTPSFLFGGTPSPALSGNSPDGIYLVFPPALLFFSSPSPPVFIFIVSLSPSLLPPSLLCICFPCIARSLHCFSPVWFARRRFSPCPDICLWRSPSPAMIVPGYYYHWSCCLRLFVVFSLRSFDSLSGGLFFSAFSVSSICWAAAVPHASRDRCHSFVFSSRF